MDLDCDSDGSTCTVGRSGNRRAFLVCADACGAARRLAFGECRADDSVFVVAGVYDEGADYDVAGQALGSMASGMLALGDLNEAELDLEWADDLGEDLDDPELPWPVGADDGEEQSGQDRGAEQSGQEDCGMEQSGQEDGVDSSPPTAAALLLEEEARWREHTRQLEEEVALWRNRACDLEDELQWYRDALEDARSVLRRSEQPPDAVAPAELWRRLRALRIRVDVTDASDNRGTKLIKLPELLQDCDEKHQAVPILTSTDRVRKAQMSAGATKAHYAERKEKHERQQQQEMAALRTRLTLINEAALQKQQQWHDAELGKLREWTRREQRRHEAEANALREWKRIQLMQQCKQHEAQLQIAAARHARELATRSKRSATWSAKRKNLQRALRRAAVARDRARTEASSAAADARATEVDNAALHAKLGESVEVAAQRQHEGARTAFTFRTILRDLLVRCHTLNAGAAHVREVTAIYSTQIAGDGRDLKLESGSRRSVLRWEKTVDILCALREGRMLRNALRAAPRTRFWAYVDLSPDARAVEQFGMGIEYAGISYVFSGREADAPPLALGRRLSGEPLTTLPNGVVLGTDGCPIVSEWFRRVFLPMLAAHGPKYAANADCFLRNLQVYGLTPSELLDDGFEFATSERADIAIPLLDRLEGIVSDAGGEVHKSGGLLETVAPGAAWRHCAAHCLNLALEKSTAFKQAGGSIRSLSSFCRGGSKHSMLVTHMLYIQQPELVPADCDSRRRQMYVDAHEQLRRHGQFHAALGGCEADPAAVSAPVEELEELGLVSQQTIARKSKKGTDVRWRYECEVVDDRLLDVAHLLAPAIMIEYGFGESYDALAIKEVNNKTAQEALALLVDPKFVFWATYMRLIYRLVYKKAFDQVQENHHRNAPALSGPAGLPVSWAAAMRSAVKQPATAKAKPQLDTTICEPLVRLLKHHPQLGGLKGEMATSAAADLLDQAERIESYFERWNSLQALVHTVAHELIIKGPLTKAACEKVSAETGVAYSDLMPRVPSAEALEAARRGTALFEQASADERAELPGTLPWLLFSPVARDGTTNLVHAELCDFAKAAVNPCTGFAHPYRCWHELAQVLVAGGAKGTPTTSAQLESLFTGLTRQQGASKVHISQPQVSYEARCQKNETMASLTESMLRDGWHEAKEVKAMLDKKGFWACDVDVAANRKLCQKLKEEMEVEEADAASDEVQPDEATWEVEKIVRHECKKGVYTYDVKWAAGDTTFEPEDHLLTCRQLLTYWRSKKNKKQLERVSKLQEAALQEKQQMEEARRRRQARPLDTEMEADPTAAGPAGRQRNSAAPSRPEASDARCKAAYDRAHASLVSARILVFDTETSGFGGCVLNLGWILADERGAELALYDCLWHLPMGERIHSRALRAHGISRAELDRSGVDATHEIDEFFALVTAARTAGVRIVAHNASFDVARLNHTAHRHGRRHITPLRSADMLCTMHGATKHCGLRTRGEKRLKAPRNEELFRFLFKRSPPEPLHRALPDCRVTLASYVQGHERRWW